MTTSRIALWAATGAILLVSGGIRDENGRATPGSRRCEAAEQTLRGPDGETVVVDDSEATYGPSPIAPAPVAAAPEGPPADAGAPPEPLPVPIAEEPVEPTAIRLVDPERAYEWAGDLPFGPEPWEIAEIDRSQYGLDEELADGIVDMLAEILGPDPDDPFADWQGGLFADELGGDLADVELVPADRLGQSPDVAAAQPPVAGQPVAGQPVAPQPVAGQPVGGLPVAPPPAPAQPQPVTIVQPTQFVTIPVGFASPGYFRSVWWGPAPVWASTCSYGYAPIWIPPFYTGGRLWPPDHSAWIDPWWRLDYLYGLPPSGWYNYRPGIDPWWVAHYSPFGSRPWWGFGSGVSLGFGFHSGSFGSFRSVYVSASFGRPICSPRYLAAPRRHVTRHVWAPVGRRRSPWRPAPPPVVVAQPAPVTVAQPLARPIVPSRRAARAVANRAWQIPGGAGPAVQEVPVGTRPGRVAARPVPVRTAGNRLAATVASPRRTDGRKALIRQTARTAAAPARTVNVIPPSAAPARSASPARSMIRPMPTPVASPARSKRASWATLSGAPASPIRRISPTRSGGERTSRTFIFPRSSTPTVTTPSRSARPTPRPITPAIPPSRIIRKSSSSRSARSTPTPSSSRLLPTRTIRRSTPSAAPSVRPTPRSTAPAIPPSRIIRKSSSSSSARPTPAPAAAATPSRWITRPSPSRSSTLRWNTRPAAPSPPPSRTITRPAPTPTPTRRPVTPAVPRPSSTALPRPTRSFSSPAAASPVIRRPVSPPTTSYRPPLTAPTPTPASRLSRTRTVTSSSSRPPRVPPTPRTTSSSRRPTTSSRLTTPRPASSSSRTARPTRSSSSASSLRKQLEARRAAAAKASADRAAAARAASARKTTSRLTPTRSRTAPTPTRTRTTRSSSIRRPTPRPTPRPAPKAPAPAPTPPPAPKK